MCWHGQGEGHKEWCTDFDDMFAEVKDDHEECWSDREGVNYCCCCLFTC